MYIKTNFKNVVNLQVFLLRITHILINKSHNYTVSILMEYLY